MTDRAMELLEAYKSLLRLRVRDRVHPEVQLTLSRLRDALADELVWDAKQVQDAVERHVRA